MRDADGKLLDETVSDSDGNYLFDDRPEGEYRVFFGDTGLFQFTEKDVAGNTADATDSDVVAATALTDLFVLSAGEHNETIDAGLILDGNGLPIEDPPFAEQTSLVNEYEADYIF